MNLFIMSVLVNQYKQAAVALLWKYMLYVDYCCRELNKWKETYKTQLTSRRHLKLKSCHKILLGTWIKIHLIIWKLLNSDDTNATPCLCHHSPYDIVIYFFLFLISLSHSPLCLYTHTQPQHKNFLSQFWIFIFTPSLPSLFFQLLDSTKS